MSILLSVLFFINIYACYLLFDKMGRQGWEGLIPFYRWYVLFEVLYGKGWQFVYTWIPFYNLYVYFKVAIDLAHAFNRDTLFGICTFLFSYICVPILAFVEDIRFSDEEDEYIRRDDNIREYEIKEDDFEEEVIVKEDFSLEDYNKEEKKNVTLLK